jgi:alpha-L-fucosidase
MKYSKSALFAVCCHVASVAVATDALPLPTPQQLAWQRHEFIAFAHFGMNTFTDREWGEGNEDPKLFNPSDFDARQWATVLKEAGVKLLILTAKHHDGFCLWPSRYTEHCVRNSPWRGGKGDVVREVVDALREKQIRVGLYLSPWDRNQPTYGDSPKYNEYFRNQLRELLTNYGSIDEVWFDGACGEGPNGKKQAYEWPSYYALIRELQPRALIAISGPDIRWLGNESGVARKMSRRWLNREPTLCGTRPSAMCRSALAGSITRPRTARLSHWPP